MGEFIEFCYTGSFSEKEKTVEQLCSILKAMSMLDFPKGRQETVKMLCSRYEVGDFEVIQELTEVYPIAELSNVQWSKTFENFSEFVSGVAFPNLSKESITEICEKFKIYNDEGRSLEQDQLLNAIIKWTLFDQENRLDLSATFIKQYIDISSITKAAIEGFTGPAEKILAQDEGLKASIEQRKSQVTAEKSMTQILNEQTSKSKKDLNKLGMLLISGGRLFDRFNAMIFSLDLNTGSWKEVTSLPQGATPHHATAMIKQRSSKNYEYFIIGG